MVTAQVDIQEEAIERSRSPLCANCSTSGMSALGPFSTR
jgi:hypothetical protein